MVATLTEGLFMVYSCVLGIEGQKASFVLGTCLVLRNHPMLVSRGEREGVGLPGLLATSPPPCGVPGGSLDTLLRAT
jgi:hypothetical protein